MASKRKPLDDARKRVKEKLHAINEHKEFIQNSIDQLTSGVQQTANSLLTETNKTKFFHKYRGVSQDLEKCLDDLLLICATISSLEDDTDEEDSDEEDDDKPPEETSAPSLKEENSPLPQHKEADLPDHATTLPADEKPLLIPSPAVHEPTPVENTPSSNIVLSDLLLTVKQKPDSEDLNASEPENLRHFANKTVQGYTGNFATDKITCPKEELKGCGSSVEPMAEQAEDQATVFFNSVQRNQSIAEKTSLELLHPLNRDFEECTLPQKSNSCVKVTSPNLLIPNVFEGTSEEIKQHSGLVKDEGSTTEITDEQSQDSSRYVNDLFTVSPARNTSSKSTDCYDRKSITLELNDNIVSAEVEKRAECSSPTAVRLQRIGFCEYKSHEREKDLVNENDKEKLRDETGVLPQTTASDAVKPREKTDKSVNKDVFETSEPNSTATDAHEKSMDGQALKDDSLLHLIQNSSYDTSGGVLRIPAFEISAGKCIKVTMKEIVSPKEFWIQKANDDFDLLMEKMCFHFSKRAKAGDKGGLKELPNVGHVCCGRYTVDNVWYRVIVTAVSCEKSEVEVLYIDEGNSESLPLSRLRELDEEFAVLPCQALRAQLRGLELRNDVNLDDVNDWFKTRVSGEILEVVLNAGDVDIEPVPLDLFICPHARTSASDLGYQEFEHNIREMLIREGFAIRSPQRPGSSADVILLSPSDKVEADRSSPLVTSGFNDASSPLHVIPTSDSPRLVSPSSDHHDSSAIWRVPPPVIPVDSDGSLYMLVSHIVSPGEFYVHFISSEAGVLDQLMTEMNKAYQDTQDTTGFSPRVGGFCCAKFSADRNWYRGLILQIRVGDSGEDASTVEVFYIDFGNTEQVNAGDLRKLLPQFMILPAQVARCSLADVNPSIKQVELDSDVFFESDMNSDDAGKTKLTRRPSPKVKAIAIAAGDEDSGDEITTGDMDLLDLLPEFEKYDDKDRLRSSISDDIAKSHQELTIFMDSAVELFEKAVGVEHISLLPKWSEKATEYFKTLTINAQKLIGYISPWDCNIFNEIASYSQGRNCSLPDLGPVLKLSLYDVSGDADVFINAALVKAKYASSSTIKDEEVVVVSDEANLTATGNWNETNHTVGENSNEETSHELPDENYAETWNEQTDEEVPVVRVHEQELNKMASVSSKSIPENFQQDSNISPPPSPISPTSQLLDSWNPMSHDYQSIRNAYNVQTDNLDIAITGYEESRGKICRFYRTRYGCYRGSKCPHKHVNEDVSSDKVLIYGSPASPVKLPDVGAWVLIKITAIYDPTHFWVQLPYGVEDLKTQVIKSRSGAETSGEENLKDFNNLMKQMGDFYSKNFKRERSLVPPTEGELVVAKSLLDSRWYRGQVCKEEANKYKILFVDYGITDWVERSNICPILPQFLHLPFQSIECYLANVEPKSDDWSEESRHHFKSLIEDKLLVCQVLSMGLNKTMLVKLFEKEGESRSITEKLIESGHAVQAKFQIHQPFDLKLLQSSKSVIIHPG